jgi:hypothetical protein
MFNRFQPQSPQRRWRRSFSFMIALMVVVGLTGVYVNLPPLGPPGRNPAEGNIWKKCPQCGKAVRPQPDGLCICMNCYEEFEAADAEAYS